MTADRPADMQQKIDSDRKAEQGAGHEGQKTERRRHTERGERGGGVKPGKAHKLSLLRPKCSRLGPYFLPIDPRLCGSRFVHYFIGNEADPLLSGPTVGFVRKAPDTFKLSRHVMIAILSV